MSTRVKALIDEATVKCGSQAALARRLKVSRQTITEWKSGREGVPDKHILALADAAGADPVPTALEVYKERLGKLLADFTAGIGRTVAVMLLGSLAVAGGAPVADSTSATDHDV